MMTIADVYRIHSKKELKYNTFIGGIGGIVTSKADLAVALIISESLIKRFEVDNGNVNAFITGGYTIGNDAFFTNVSIPYRVELGSALTYFVTLQKKVVISVSAFRQTGSLNPNKQLFYFNEPVFDDRFQFQSVDRSLIVLKNVTPIGITSGDNDVFELAENNIGIFDVANQTNNGGSPDGDIVDFLSNTGNSVVYRTDTTPPPKVTDLSLVSVSPTSITFDFTYPNITPKLYRQIWIFVDGKLVYFSDILDNKTAANLTQTSKELQVVLMDEYGNISEFSNPILGTPTGAINTAVLFAAASAYYKLNGTSGAVTDSTPNAINGSIIGSVTRGVTGIIGNAFRFLGAGGGHVDLTDNDLFSFTDGTNDVEGTIGIWIKPNTVSGIYGIISKENTTTGAEWSLLQVNDRVVFSQWSEGALTSRLRSEHGSILKVGKWHLLTVTLDGNGTVDSNLVYVNGEIRSKINTETGTYVRCFNTTTTAKIGYHNNAVPRIFDGDIDEGFIIKGRQLTAAQISDLYNLGNGVTY